MIDELDLSKFEGHTPGPWTVAAQFGWPAYVVPTAHKGRRYGFAADPAEDQEHYAQEICKVRKDRHQRGDHESNAALIAAAPALLAEVKRLRAWRDRLREPTPEMLDAAYAQCGMDTPDLALMFQVMIDAAEK